MSAEIIRFRSQAETDQAELENMPQSWETLIARMLLRHMPHYRYDLSRLPKLDPPPRPGVPSALAAARAILVKIDGGGSHTPAA